MSGKLLLGPTIEGKEHLMRDQDRQPPRSHWDELAEQLGVPTGSEAVPPAPPPSAKEEAAAKPRHAESAGQQPESLPMNEPGRRGQHSGGRRRRPSHPPEDAPEAHQPNEAEHPAPREPLDSDRPEAEGASEPADRKRSRRRTSRSSPTRSAPAEETEAGAADRPREPMAEDPAAETGSEETGSRGRRRGRGGRGRTREPVAAETARASTHPAQMEDESREDDSDEEIDTLSDWNVPSWFELIASLYRPER